MNLAFVIVGVRFQIRIDALLHLHELFKAATLVTEAGPGMECRGRGANAKD